MTVKKPNPRKPNPREILHGLQEGKTITYLADGMYYDLHVTGIDAPRDLPIVKVDARTTNPAEQFNARRIGAAGITGVLLGSSDDDLEIRVHTAQLLPNQTPILEIIGQEGQVELSLLPIPKSPPLIR